MTNNAEERVSKFYNTIGWETNGEITEDARRFEDLREYAQEYVGKCRLRVLKYIPAEGINILDMASGPIQFREYLKYSEHFKKRYCVDLSSGALEQAKRKIGEHGVFLHGSFFDIPMEDNIFDCTISLHTIYHIDKDKQEEAVRKLLSVTKPRKPVIIVYGNPNTIVSYLLSSLPIRILKKFKSILRKFKKRRKQQEEVILYFYLYSLDWWNRFSDTASVEIHPYRSFSSNIQKILIPNNKIGKRMFALLFKLEEQFPEFFVKYFQYPIIVLTKK